MRKAILGLLVLGCGPKKPAEEVKAPPPPKLVPIVEAEAWVNKMPGIIPERDAKGNPIWPGRLFLRVYGDAKVFKVVIKDSAQVELGEADLIERPAERGKGYASKHDLRLNEGDTLRLVVWMLVGRDTVADTLEGVVVKAVY